MTDSLASDLDRVRAYGDEVAGTFGGVYVDGAAVVALFTTDPARHEAVLRDRLAAPHRLRVRAAERSYAEVEATNARLPGVLADAGLDAVRTIAIAVHDGAFVVEVGLAPYAEATAAQVRALAAPDPVVVREVGTPVLVKGPGPPGDRDPS